MTPELLQWAAQAIAPGAVVRDVRRLAGATSSTLYALDVESNGHSLPLVLRVYDNTVWLEQEPDIPTREAAVLRKVTEAGLSVPALVACDPTGADAGGIPALLMTRLPGRTWLTPDDLDSWLHELAAALLPVHAVSADGLPWRYKTYVNLSGLTPPAWSRVPHLWERAIPIAQGPPPPGPECLIHRDYHPNNVLWQGGRVSGIVDWTVGCRGNANVDVAWCRKNLIHVHGIQAADRFLRAYERLAGAAFTYHPYWDLLDLMEELPGPPSPYPPWAEFGAHGITGEMMQARADEHLKGVMSRL